VTTYYACRECSRIYDYDEPCHFPDDLAVIHQRPDGNHWFELTNGHVLRDWLIKKESETSTEPTPATRHWEYRVVVVELGMDAILNDQGKQGWELVSITGGAVPPDNRYGQFAYFKREVIK
jgi:hypothetical protein